MCIRIYYVSEVTLPPLPLSLSLSLFLALSLSLSLSLFFSLARAPPSPPPATPLFLARVVGEGTRYRRKSKQDQGMLVTMSNQKPAGDRRLRPTTLPREST